MSTHTAVSTHTMVRVGDKRLLRRSIGQIKVAGFNLIELLVAICVMGVLAAVTFFALAGVAGAGSVAACGSNARMVNQAAQALIVENPSGLPATPEAWKLALLGKTQPGVWTSVATGAPFLSAWPASSTYSFSIAGTSSLATTGDIPSINPANGDVIVSAFTLGKGTRTFDSTVDPAGACSRT